MGADLRVAVLASDPCRPLVTLANCPLIARHRSLAMTWSPAHLAVEQEDLPRLRELLDAGHDVEDDNGDGWTLLRHALDVERDTHVQSGQPLHADITAYLLVRGADPLRAHNGMPVVVEPNSAGTGWRLKS
jgi:hypothetical protein